MNLRTATLAGALILGISQSSHAASEVKGVQTPLRATLPNGMRVVIVPDSVAPVATVELSVLAGGDESPRQFPGMAHAQEHMAFRGCSGMTADQTSAIYSYLGGQNNAETEQTVTEYYVTVPSTDLEVALRLQSACVNNIEDLPQEWAKERGAIEQEVEMDVSDPWYRLEQRIDEDMFAGTPYAQDALGTKDSFDVLTSDALKTFYRQWYAPNNMILVVAGDVDPESTLAAIRRLFGDEAPRELPPRPTIRISPVRTEIFTMDSDLPNYVDVIAYRFPGTDSSDYAASLVLADALASRRGNLYKLETSGHALDVDFDIMESHPKAGIAFAEVEVSGDDKPGETVSRVEKILDTYVRQGIPPEMIEAAKRSELTHAEFVRTSIPGLADAWSNALGTERHDSPDVDIDAICKVTPADVNRVARQLLDKRNRVVGVLVPSSASGPKVEAHVDRSEKNTTTPIRSIELPSWAASALAGLKVPQEGPAVSDTTLRNGLRLIVRTDSSSPTVMVRGTVKRILPSRSSPYDALDAEVLDEMFDHGTRKLASFAFQKALDDIGAEEVGGYQFALDVLRENFSRGVQLLAENELHPRLKAHDFHTAMRQITQEFDGDQRSPEARSSQALATALLPPGDPELREIKPGSLRRLNLAQLREFYASAIRPDLTTVVVVGDVSPKDAKAVVEKWFGAWKTTGPTPDTTLPPVPMNTASSVEISDPDASDDTVTLAEQLPLSRSDPDYLPLKLGNAILGGDFEGARLYHDLRQVSGYVYSVDLGLDAAKKRAEYAISFGSAPENTRNALSLIRRDLEEMRTAEVSREELHQAKAYLLRQIPLNEANEEDVALGLLACAEAGLPLDEPLIEARKYLDVTAAQVRTAFVDKVRLDGFVQVVRGPALGNKD